MPWLNADKSGNSPESKISWDAALGQDDARTLYQPAFACELEMVGDEGRVEYHVAVDKDDVVAFCLR